MGKPTNNTPHAHWAKLHDDGSTYPLISHLLDTAASATVIWDLWLRPGLRTLIASALANGDETEGRQLIAAVAGLHDVGKATKVFQTQAHTRYTRPPATDAYLAENTEKLRADGYDVAVAPLTLDLESSIGLALRRHETMSLFAVAGRWPTGDDEVRNLWAGFTVGGHHGQFHPHEMKQGERDPQMLRPGYDLPAPAAAHFCSLTTGAWGSDQQALINLVLRGAQVTHDQMNRPLSGPNVAAATILITGIVVLADWLASEAAATAAGAQLHTDPISDPSAWTVEREQWFADRIHETLGIYEDLSSPRTRILGRWSDAPTDLQVAAEQVTRGLWIVSSPTGEGKTEAALLRHAAVTGEGLIVALPTRATTDSMVSRVRAPFAGTRNVVALRHGYSILDETATGAPASQNWLSWRLRELLAPVTVSTCDQVLLASLKQKHSFLRLLAVANRHIVLDEVHTYDAYQSKLVEGLLEWWGATDTRVTLLSATLPQAQLTRFAQAYSLTTPAAEYPGHTLVVEGAQPIGGPVGTKRVYRTLFVQRNTTKAGHLAYVVDAALNYRRASADSRIGIIVNTVDRALNIGRELAAAGQRVIVLHSRMTAAHRKTVTERLVAELGPDGTGAGLIVVGTQAVEASLDVDFDQMITDLAPAASLVQRGGRLWRHSAVVDGVWVHRRARPTAEPTVDVIVIRDEDGTLFKWDQLPYAAQELQRTLTALDQVRGVLAVPAGVQAFVDAAYFDFEAADADLEGPEMSAAMTRLARAKDVVIPMRHHPLLNTGILHERVTVKELSGTTTQDQEKESATRFIEQVTLTVLLLDPTGRAPQAWHGSPSAAAAVSAHDVDTVRQLIGATVPIAQHKLEKLSGIHIHTEKWAPRVAALRGFTLVTLTDPAAYDQLLGFVGV